MRFMRQKGTVGIEPGVVAGIAEVRVTRMHPIRGCDDVGLKNAIVAFFNLSRLRLPMVPVSAATEVVVRDAMVHAGLLN